MLFSPLHPKNNQQGYPPAHPPSPTLPQIMTSIAPNYGTIPRGEKEMCTVTVCDDTPQHSVPRFRMHTWSCFAFAFAVLALCTYTRTEKSTMIPVQSRHLPARASLPHHTLLKVELRQRRGNHSAHIRHIKTGTYFVYHLFANHSGDPISEWAWEDWVERILFGKPADDGRRLSGRGLHNAGNTEFLAVLDVGTPPKPHELIVDTGSSNTWVAGSICRMPGCNAMQRYDPSRSETWEPLPDEGSKADGTFQLTYGTGSCAGFLGRDVLFVGGTSVLHPLGVATTVAPFFENVPYADGILGLGMRSLSDGDLPTLLDSMKTANKISRRVMAVYLASEGEEVPSQMTFGGPDTALYKGTMEYVPLLPLRGRYLYFIIKFDGFWVDGLQLPLRCRGGCKAVIDSGTSLLLGPPDDISKTTLALGVSGCRPTKGLQVGIAGKLYTIPPSVLTLSDGTECVSALQADTMMPDLFIFGDTFFRAVYTVCLPNSNSDKKKYLIKIHNTGLRHRFTDTRCGCTQKHAAS